MLTVRVTLLVWASTRTGLHASMVNKHIICLITHISVAPLFTLLQRLPLLPEKPSLL